MVTIGYTPGLAYSTSPTDSYGFAPAHITFCGLPCNPSLDSHQDGCIVNAVGTGALENKKAALECTLLAEPLRDIL